MKITMKVKVDRDLCEANGICMGQAPEVFRLGRDDHLQILLEEPGEELQEKVRAAVRLCPRQALTLAS